MTFTSNGENVTVEMTRDEWEMLLQAVGIAAGSALRPLTDAALFWKWIDFANRLNATNPRFKPYEIPKERQTK